MNLVTGATGIIGSHVVLKLLQQNKPVIASKQSTSDVSKIKSVFSFYACDHLFEKIKWVNLDITDVFSIEDALEGVSVVYHCAGLVSYQKNDALKLQLINEIGTANLVNICLNKKIKAFCHVSSIATINNNDYEGELTEGVFWKTSGSESNYAISKYNAEREVWRASEEGLNTVIVNPGVVIAAGNWNQSSAALFNLAQKGNLFYTRGSSGYVNAVDVAEIMIQLIEKSIFNERFILIEKHYSHLEILSYMQKAFNKAIPKFELTKWHLKLIQKLESFICLFTSKSPQLTKESVEAAFGTKRYSSLKIQKVLNYPFTPVNSFINQICEWKLKESKDL